MTRRPDDPPAACVPKADVTLDVRAAWLEQRHRLRTLVTLAERQAELLEAGDADGLVAVLLAKQPLVEQVVAAQHDLARAGTASEAAVRGECQRLLADLTAREAAAQAAATELRDRFAHQARALTDGQRARTAYQPFTPARAG